MLEKFINIFEGADHFYGQAKRINNPRSVKVEVNATTQKGTVTKELWQKHLDGVGSQLGIAPLKKDGTCKWGAIDIDKNNYDYQELLNKIRKLKLPLIMFRSKSGRAHVYMFMKNFHEAEEVKHVMKKLAAKIGVADILDRIYPMQTNMDNVEYGSWLNMPYFDYEEGSTYAYTDDFEDATLEQFFEMHEKYAQEDLTEFLQEEVESVTKPKKIKQKTIEDFFLPCTINALKDGGGKIKTANRNDLLHHIFSWCKNSMEKGIKKIPEFSNFDAKQLLHYFNKNYLDEPLEEKEINNTILKSENKEYNYLCRRPDIKRFCDPSACTRHICGITPEKALEIANAKEAMGHIVEYKSNPPMFFEHTEVKDGKEMKLIRVEMSGSELINKEKWVNKLADAAQFPHPAILDMKPKEFTLMQYSRLEKKVVEEAPEEADVDYEFKMLVYEFIRKQTVSFEKHALLDNACYVDRKTHELHFKISDLMSYLKTMKINEPIRRITYKLKQVLNAKKTNGDVYNDITKKRVSCPTWHFKSDPNQYMVKGDNAKEITHEKD
jgi:hypothetical protein